MKNSITKITKEILSLENTIRMDFPELIKYISEMPFERDESYGDDIRMKSLEDYYNSLKEVRDHYALSHKE